MRKISKIDISSEKPVEIKSLNKKKEILFQQKNIVVDSNYSTNFYIIFCLESLSEKYLLDYDELLTLIYLYELGLFELKIKIIERSINLSKFTQLGYITSDFTHKKKSLYKLTDKAIDIVDNFFKLMNNRETFIYENRKTDLSTKNKVKSVLGKFFSD